VSCGDGHCITCSDQGIEMTVLHVDGDMALCRAPEGEQEEIDVSLIDAVQAGDRILAHARVALVRLHPAEVAA
jgi:hypothetical protein